VAVGRRDEERTLVCARMHASCRRERRAGSAARGRIRGEEEAKMPLNILVVDDSSVVRAMIVKALRLAEVPLGDVFQAANGREGLDVLDENWIDLIFVDINMPVMNGEEMVDRIRASREWQDLPVVVVSTEGSSTRIERLRQKGAMFIHKPFTPEEVRKAVRDLTKVCHERQA